MSGMIPIRITDYLRLHPVRGLNGPLQARPLSESPEEHRFLLLAGDQRAVLACYTQHGTRRAQREAAGLWTGGKLGLAPALLLTESEGGPLGGAVLAWAQPEGTSLGGRLLSDTEVRQWAFLLLTVHHLAPDQVRVQGGAGNDLAIWWRSTQAAWEASRIALTPTSTQPLLAALTRLRAVVSARVEARKSLWHNLRPRPTHGSPIPSNIYIGKRPMLVEWGGFGLADPAMEVGHVAANAAISGEMSIEAGAKLIDEYLAGMRDLGDRTLDERVEVFASVAPLGESFELIRSIGRAGLPPQQRQANLRRLVSALTWTQKTLGTLVGDARELVMPLASDGNGGI
ncbi:MAG TPA: hypothetical protein VF807_02885 [Ktedonobacterales bacterium]